MDVPLSACPAPEVSREISASLDRLPGALALPEEAGALFLEVLKFLSTVALIGVTGLLLLLLE
uniref:Uncharacterized protein n=1 Tax=Desulfobacca acetoxidans TaxID=60893 RepID=A0A7C5AM14_9BACT